MGKEFKHLLILALAGVLLLLPAAGLASQQPETKEVTVTVEGMPETVMVTRYVQEGLFAVWYDAQRFIPEQTEKGVRLILLDNQLTREVSYGVERLWQPERTDPFTLEELLETWRGQGWECDEMDATGMLPLFSFPDQPVRAFFARREGENALVYLTSIASGEFECVLRFPNEAAEGWGARMMQLINTVEAVDGF